MNFDKNPFTGFLATSENEDSVKNALRNLLLTNKGERFYDSDKGGGIRDRLFELTDPSNYGDFELIKMDIKSTIAAYEPRAIVQDVYIEPNPNENSLYIQIVFQVRNVQDQVFNLDLHIERVR